jgi:hypothetical protein
MNMLRWCLNVAGSREGWKLYIVTDGEMIGIYLGEGAQCEKWVVFWWPTENNPHLHWDPSPSSTPTITSSDTIYSSHPSLLPTTLGTMLAGSYLIP